MELHPSQSDTSRRGVVRDLGLVLLAAQAWPLVARAAPGALVIHSTPGFFFHTHDLWLPYAALKAPPPRGVTLVSSTALNHSHTVVLSREQLLRVGRGGVVAVRASSHTFAVALARTAGGPSPLPQPQRSRA
jgi:hypothetical protein